MSGPCHAHENRGCRNWGPTLRPPFFAAKRPENFGISMPCHGGNGKICHEFCSCHTPAGHRRPNVIAPRHTTTMHPLTTHNNHLASHCRAHGWGQGLQRAFSFSASPPQRAPRLPHTQRAPPRPGAEQSATVQPVRLWQPQLSLCTPRVARVCVGGGACPWLGFWRRFAPPEAQRPQLPKPHCQL